MTRSARETVEHLIRAGAAQDYASTLELLSEHSFSRVDNGRIYIGHRGISDWIRDCARDYEALEFATESIRELAGGFVLVVGTERRTKVRGGEEAVPGVWLHHVQDDKVTAVVYFRTEAEALRSISGPGRGETPTELIERNISAYNRRDFVELVSLTRPDIRFSSSVREHREPHHGIGALARLLASLEDEYDSVLVESHQLSELGEGFVLVDAVVRIDSEDGAVERHDAVWLARIEDHQVAEFILFDEIDSARAAAAARIAAHPDGPGNPSNGFDRS